MNKTMQSLCAYGVCAVLVLATVIGLLLPSRASGSGNTQVNASSDAGKIAAAQKHEGKADENKADENATANAAPEEEAATTEESSEQQDEEVDEREQFISTWAERIDNFNAGYPLAGYGRVFAEAALDYGLDPRLSPAIARVETGSGQNCVYPYNAWGWGASSWSSWEEGIWSVADGLAANYGYTVSYEMAQSYNADTVDEWYNQVTSCMSQIWESDSL